MSPPLINANISDVFTKPFLWCAIKSAPNWCSVMVSENFVAIYLSETFFLGGGKGAGIVKNWGAGDL